MKFWPNINFVCVCGCHTYGEFDPANQRVWTKCENVNCDRYGRRFESPSVDLVEIEEPEPVIVSSD